MTKEQMKKLEVRMINELKKAEEIARKIEALTGQDLKIEDVKKESTKTTLTRMEKIRKLIKEWKEE